MYTPLGYLFEAQTLYDAIEESTGRVITTSDAKHTASMWALFINSARRKVLSECILALPDSLPVQREVISVLSSEVDLRGVASPLEYEPEMVRYLEQDVAGRYLPIDLVARFETWRYDDTSAYASAMSFVQKGHFDGNTLRLMPASSGARNLRVTYIAVPTNFPDASFAIGSGNGDNVTTDKFLPSIVQDAVPVYAAMLASVRDARAHQMLSGLWQEKVSEIRQRSILFQNAEPESIRYTGAAE